MHGELQRKLSRFKDVAGPPSTGAPLGGQNSESDLVARFIRWYNYERPHESLDMTMLETPAQAFSRKMHTEEESSPCVQQPRA